MNYDQRLHQLRKDILRRSKVERYLSRLASQNPALRRLLFNHPHQAVHDLLGVTIPDVIGLTIVQNTESRVHFILPWDSQLEDDKELSDHCLDCVSGGSNPGTILEEWIRNRLT